MIPYLHKAVVINTPEGVEFKLPLANPFARLIAILIDMTCISLIISIVGKLSQPFLETNPDVGQSIMILAGFIVAVGYFIFSEAAWKGQTLGKRLLKLQVIDQAGLKLQFGQIVIRNLFRVIDSMPFLYFVGGLFAGLTPKSQRLGDLAAHTIVVQRMKLSPPDLAQITGDHYNSFINHPHLIARCRQKISPELADLILDAILRRKQLDPDARVQLYHELATYLGAQNLFPEDTTHGLTNEQILRNYVDVLFNDKKLSLNLKPTT